METSVSLYRIYTNQVPRFSLENDVVIQFFTAIVCPEKSEALVYYPTTFGNEWAEIRCADHAHRITIEDSVLCDSNGDWSNQSPECQCDSGNRQTTGNGRQICEG